MGSFNVIDYIDPECFEDEDEKEDLTSELTGKIYFDTWGDDGEVGFSCGPEVQGGYLSDCLSIYSVLDQILTKEIIGVEVDIGVSENMHTLMVDDNSVSLEEALRKVRNQIEKLKNGDFKSMVDAWAKED